MCPPMLIGAAAAMSAMSASTMFAVSLGTAALSAGVTMLGQHQAANAQAEATTANLQATRDAAVDSQVRQDGDLHARESQLKTATAIDLDNQKKNVLRAKGTASASSEAAGLTFDSMLSDYDRQYGNYADSQMQQLGFDIGQIERTREGIQSQTQARVNAVPRPPINRPSWITGAASIASSAFNSFDTYSVRDPITGNRTFT